MDKRAAGFIPADPPAGINPAARQIITPARKKRTPTRSVSEAASLTLRVGIVMIFLAGVISQEEGVFTEKFIPLTCIADQGYSEKVLLTVACAP